MNQDLLLEKSLEDFQKSGFVGESVEGFQPHDFAAVHLVKMGLALDVNHAGRGDAVNGFRAGLGPAMPGADFQNLPADIDELLGL
jgi:hypothetical protein